jgi:hypothetical protein
MFFFEKKNQKTFVFKADAGRHIRDSHQEFFASFFQKRSAYLRVWEPPTWHSVQSRRTATKVP